MPTAQRQLLGDMEVREYQNKPESTENEVEAFGEQLDLQKIPKPHAP
jgi:hypothetical protein